MIRIHNLISLFWCTTLVSGEMNFSLCTSLCIHTKLMIGFLVVWLEGLFILHKWMKCSDFENFGIQMCLDILDDLQFVSESVRLVCLLCSCPWAYKKLVKKRCLVFMRTIGCLYSCCLNKPLASWWALEPLETIGNDEL